MCIWKELEKVLRNSTGGGKMNSQKSILTNSGSISWDISCRELDALKDSWAHFVTPAPADLSRKAVERSHLIASQS